MDATIIIPTYNRRDALLETLAALARQDYSAGAWEAVVVDDGSKDDTEQAVADWVARTGAPVRYLKQANAGPAAARNRGAAIAQSPVLIFIDNDIIVPPNFVRAHLATLAAHPGCWILGRIAHPRAMRATAFGRFRDDQWEGFFHSHPKGQVSETMGISAANISLPAADFHRLGGFDSSFTIASSEDWDLGVRARKAGVRVMFQPDIVVVHNDWAVSLERYCERQRLYSMSDVLLWHKYGDASLRADLVRQNGPIRFRADSAGMILKKCLKRLFTFGPGPAIVRGGCRLAERLMPDSRVARRAYHLAVGLAIFQGVRDGFYRYGPAPLGKVVSGQGSDVVVENHS